MQTRKRPVLSDADKEVTSTTAARCTAGCTENESQTTDDRLASLVAGLSASERRRLADLLEIAGLESSKEPESRGRRPEG